MLLPITIIITILFNPRTIYSSKWGFHFPNPLHNYVQRLNNLPVEIYPGTWPDFAANLAFTPLYMCYFFRNSNSQIFKLWKEFSGSLGRGKPLHLYGQLIIARSWEEKDEMSLIHHLLWRKRKREQRGLNSSQLVLDKAGERQL